MKNVFCMLFSFGLLLTAVSVNAQFRKIPGVVTDSLKAKYPNAKNVTWEDKLSLFKASFSLDSGNFEAKFSSKGEWKSSERKITPEQIPAPVKDGLSKSKYADWKVGTVIIRYLPGNITQYAISVSKSDFQKKNLLFGDTGQLLKDNTTL
ncbi:PepSY-like domain-containing protein [Flavitalea flava]